MCPIQSVCVCIQIHGKLRPITSAVSVRVLLCRRQHTTKLRKMDFVKPIYASKLNTLSV